MIEPLAAPHFALCAFMLLWNILIAGRIAGRRDAPPIFSGITALGGLLIAPALIISVATASILQGRALDTVVWVWPVTLVLIAVQAVYATVRRLVHPTIGIPLSLFNLFVAAGAVIRYLSIRGVVLPDIMIAIPATQAGALTLLAGTPALTSPLYFHVPLLAPAFGARWRASLFVRMIVATIAGAWFVVFAIRAPQALAAVRGYTRFSGEPLRERVANDFAIGLRILPPLTGPPSPLALRGDLALVDTLAVDAVSVVIQPVGATRPALDSLARTLDQLRRDSTLLIVALGDGRNVRNILGGDTPFPERERIAALTRIAARLRPDIMLPVLEPYGTSARVFGTLPLDRWQKHLARARSEVRRVDSRIAIGVTIAGFGVRDSALYAWAARPASPVDVVGFAIAPTSRGATGLTARMRLLDGWMSASRSTKPHWVFSAAGFPVAHGERGQERALWGELAWATANARIKGFVVADAGDYSDMRGLRTIGGRIRPAVGTLERAARALRERATPAPLP